ncbi:MerR family transcriptional regulator [Adhaeribacter pallidiroseus]|uniref:Helix-turn-helix domain-containing protein n=1 Tax=Adhaeribacter pallidiroseus TaxID=2072847 RepID=A0A369QM39_9BACT|nr:helix-turn-helix domain-containing protein [Adhaeribacter pallidiroseus]RDC63308.1 hypothetical protein AHMF7616_01910 [Adhaeribacter pallidiroseus]
MKPEDLLEIATKGDLELFGKAIIAELNRLLKVPDVGEEEKYFTLDGAAEFTGHDRSTVKKWINKGKLDNNGKLVKLPTSEFAPGFPRIAKSDLIAFGRIGLESAAIKRKNNLPNNPLKLVS